MRKKTGLILIVLGVLLIAVAICLVFHNAEEDYNAGKSSEIILEQVKNSIDERSKGGHSTPASVELPDEQGSITAETDTDFETDVVTETEPSTNQTPAVEIDGDLYIGYIALPTIGITLPVMADWSNEKLMSAPCRHFGSLESNDLVIAGHNYTRHFGKLDRLQLGDSIIFTDMNGVCVAFKVEKIETVPGDDVAAVQQSGFDLVLYTCNYTGKSRIMVFCNRADKE